MIIHDLREDACRFLFIKKDYERLLEYIQEFHDESNDEKWLNKYVKYVRKYRELNKNDSKVANKFVVKHIKWLLDKQCDTVALN